VKVYSAKNRERAHLLPRINWMREKFCKHPSTNEEHGFE